MSVVLTSLNRGTEPGISGRYPEVGGLVNADKCHILHLGTRNAKKEYIMAGQSEGLGFSYPQVFKSHLLSVQRQQVKPARFTWPA